MYSIASCAVNQPALTNLNLPQAFSAVWYPGKAVTSGCGSSGSIKESVLVVGGTGLADSLRTPSRADVGVGMVTAGALGSSRRWCVKGLYKPLEYNSCWWLG